MRQTLLKLAIAILTFIIGVVVSVTWLEYRTSLDDRLIEPVRMIEEPGALSCFPGLSKEVNALCPEHFSYFPPGAFDSDESAKPNEKRLRDYWSQHAIDRYSEVLRAMEEPSLLAQPGCEGEGYRFLWLRSFAPPIAVRIWRSGDKQFLITKALDRVGDHKPGKLVINIRFPSEGEWAMLARLQEQTCFWQLPAMNITEVGDDGAMWILEGVKEGRYRVIERWSPKSGAFRESCLYLLKISGLEIDKDEVY